MTAVMTRQDIKDAQDQLVKHLNDTYGYHWDNPAVEHDPYVIAYRRIYDRPEVKARANGTGYMPTPQEENLADLDKNEKEQYIVEQYKAGTLVDKICHNLGYQSNTPMYRILKKHGVEVKRTQKTSMITQEMLIEASENAACTSEIAKALEQYSPEINTVDVRHLFERFGMQKAYKTITKRWRYRYLIEDGNVTRYDNLTQLARHLGIKASTLSNDTRKDNPKYKVLTWKEMRDCEDI